MAEREDHGAEGGHGSEVPAKERMVAVTEQLDETERRIGGVANKLETADQRAMAERFPRTERKRDREVTNRSFPQRGASQRPVKVLP